MFGFRPCGRPDLGIVDGGGDALLAQEIPGTRPAAVLPHSRDADNAAAIARADALETQYTSTRAGPGTECWPTQDDAPIQMVE